MYSTGGHCPRRRASDVAELWCTNPTGANEDIGSIDWTNADKITASDNDRASVELEQTARSDYLAIKWVDDLSALPDDATITGTNVYFEWYADDSGMKMIYARYKAVGGAGWLGADWAGNFELPLSEEVDMFGTTPATLQFDPCTPAILKNANFTLLIRVRHVGDSEESIKAYIDHVRLKVTYTPAGGAGAHMHQYRQRRR